MAHLQPSLTHEGVGFSVLVDSVARQCLITSEALSKVCEFDVVADKSGGILALFHAHEAMISGVARRLAAAGVGGTPLVIRASTLVVPRAQ